MGERATGRPLVEFLDDMRLLRERCPWKSEQTHRSLARYLLEEAHETLDAIDSGDPDHLREELGDVLLQVYFHAVIAEEEGAFTLDDVAAGIAAKMRRRNPHVFGEAATTMSAVEVDQQWQRIKAAEKARSSVADGLAPTLPALLLATKVVERLDGGTTDPAADGTEVGERLLAVVRDAVALGVDPEQALRDAVRRAAGPA